MVHNNGRPVTFPHLRMRNTETGCIFVGLSIIGAHLALGLEKKWKCKKIFANCIQRGMNLVQSESLDWDASCSKAKCEEKTVVVFPMHLYAALWINLNVSNTAASKWRNPANCFLSVLPSLPPSLQHPEPEPRQKAFDDQIRDTIVVPAASFLSFLLFNTLQ